MIRWSYVGNQADCLLIEARPEHPLMPRLQVFSVSSRPLNKASCSFTYKGMEPHEIEFFVENAYRNNSPPCSQCTLKTPPHGIPQLQILESSIPRCRWCQDHPENSVVDGGIQIMELLYKGWELFHAL